MAKEMTNKLREEIENIIYTFFDKLDPTKTNSDYYKEKFSNMKNAQFMKFISTKFPYRYHVDPFKTEPTMVEIKDALNFINVPIIEKIALNHLYKDENGNAVTSHYATTGYLPLKKMKQFQTKKSHIDTSTSQRNMKDGLLVAESKGGKESDREFEALFVFGLENTAKEFYKYRADAIKAKSAAYSMINYTGQLSMEDIPDEVDDSLSRNLLNSQLIAAQLKSNIIESDYTLNTSDKKREVLRK